MAEWGDVEIRVLELCHEFTSEKCSGVSEGDEVCTMCFSSDDYLDIRSGIEGEPLLQEQVICDIYIPAGVKFGYVTPLPSMGDDEVGERYTFTPFGTGDDENSFNDGVCNSIDEILRASRTLPPPNDFILNFPGVGSHIAGAIKCRWQGECQGMCWNEYGEATCGMPRTPHPLDFYAIDGVMYERIRPLKYFSLLGSRRDGVKMVCVLPKKYEDVELWIHTRVQKLNISEEGERVSVGRGLEMRSCDAGPVSSTMWGTRKSKKVWKMFREGISDRYNDLLPKKIFC